MELKLLYQIVVAYIIPRFNRTFMELKPYHSYHDKHVFWVLIGPSWN